MIALPVVRRFRGRDKSRRRGYAEGDSQRLHRGLIANPQSPRRGLTKHSQRIGFVTKPALNTINQRRS